MSKELEKRIEAIEKGVVKHIEESARNSRKFAELAQTLAEQKALAIVDRNVGYSTLCLVFNIIEEHPVQVPGLIALESIRGQAKKHLERIKNNEKAWRLGMEQLDATLSSLSEELARAAKAQ